MSEHTERRQYSRADWRSSRASMAPASTLSAPSTSAGWRMTASGSCSIALSAREPTASNPASSSPPDLFASTAAASAPHATTPTVCCGRYRPSPIPTSASKRGRRIHAAAGTRRATGCWNRRPARRSRWSSCCHSQPSPCSIRIGGRSCPMSPSLWKTHQQPCRSGLRTPFTSIAVCLKLHCRRIPLDG